MLAPLARWRLPLGAVGAVTLLAGAAFLAAAQLAFESGAILDVAAPLVALVIGCFGAIAWSEFAERRVRTRVTRDNELLEQRVRERTADLADAEREIATASAWRWNGATPRPACTSSAWAACASASPARSG